MLPITPSPRSNTEKTQAFYENSYQNLGFSAQRKYPNEELCRFMGRNFFHVPPEDRASIKILETGCGSGGNLWMIGKEGFDTYGIDLSPEAIILSNQMLDVYGVTANLSEQNMAYLNFREDYFDAVVDVFSSYCLVKEEHKIYLEGVKKILKPGGVFFSYFPSKASEAYQFSQHAPFIDPDTLAGISREDSPFFGQDYPFRFVHSREYENSLKQIGLDVTYSEVVNRTYRGKQEQFGFVVIEARKI